MLSFMLEPVGTPIATSSTANRPQCPDCHASALFANGKPYCSACPWNRRAARRKLIGSFISSSAAALLFVYVIYVAFKASQSPRVVPLVIHTIVVLSVAVKFRTLLGDWRTLRDAEEKIQGIPYIPSPPKQPSPALDVPAYLVDPSSRTIELRRDVAKLLVVGTVVVLLGSILAALSPMLGAAHDIRRALLLFGFVFAIGAGRYVHDYKLASRGNVTMARVSRQRSWSNRGDDDHRVYYEFETSAGKIVRDSFQDASHRLYEGMQFPVFYLAAWPRINRPVDASWFQVRTVNPRSAGTAAS